MKLITSTDLQNWAKTRESEQYLPLLLRRLIINNVGFNNIQYIKIPGGDSIWKPGVDGKILTRVDSLLGEKNKTYLVECGQCIDYKQKFEKDLRKRTNQLEGIKQKNSVFVFITTSKIQDADEVLQATRNKVENSDLWADIKLFDADSIETWLDHDFATFAWLADIMGKQSNGLKDFDGFWRVWRASTEIPIDEDVILARSGNYQSEINKFLNKDSGVFHIKSASRKESLLFFMASILKAPFKEDAIDAIKSKIVIVQNADVWNRVVEDGEASKFILIPLFGIPENLGFLVDKCLQVFIPMDENDGKGTEPNTVYIEPFNNEILYSVLETKLGSYERTNQIINKLGHNGTLLHLQRIMERKDVSSPAPEWANKEISEILLLAAFVGSWSDRNARDREALSSIFGIEYAEIVKKLSFHIKTEEAPIRKIGDIWEVSSPDIIIDYLGGYLTEDTLGRYLNETKKILSEIDVRYNESGTRSLLVSYDFNSGKHTYYSRNLIDGIANGYAAIANNEDKFVNLNGVAFRIQQNIQELLEDKNWKKWATLNPIMPLFAEAAKEKYLELLENVVNDAPSLMTDLYEKGEDIGFMGECLYSGILWGLENLAWFEPFFMRVVNILIKMEQIRKENLRYGNSPSDTLNRVFCTWLPNTLVDLDKRQLCISTLLRTNKSSDVLFNLLYSLLPVEHMTCQPTHRPKFIELRDQERESRTDIDRFNSFIYAEIINMLGDNKDRWDKISRYITYMNPERFDMFMNKLYSIDWQNAAPEFKNFVYQNLDHWADSAKRWSDENAHKWGVTEKIARISEILNALMPTNPIDKNIRIFSKLSVWDYRECSGRPSPRLQQAIQEIISSNGVQGLIDFAKQIDAVDVLGEELALSNISVDDVVELLNSPARKDPKVQRFLAVLFAVIINIRGVAVASEIFNDDWEIEYKQALIGTVKGNEAYWEWVDEKGFSEFYWKNTGTIWPNTDKEYDIAISKLKEFKKFPELATLLAMQTRRQGRVRTEDIVELLFGIAESSKEPLNNMDWYHIQELFKILYKRPDIDEQIMFNLEINYFELFDGSNELEPIYVYKYLKANPELFIEVISLMFSKKVSSEDKSEEEQHKLENAAKIAQKIYFKLEKDYIFNSQSELRSWIMRVVDMLEKLEDKELCRLGMGQIGAMLANCPTDPNDGIWPIGYVREVFEEVCNQDIMEGLMRGKYNSCGFHSVDRRNPGGYWEERAKKFRNDAAAIRFQYPKTAEILDYLTKDFEMNAKRANTYII